METRLTLAISNFGGNPFFIDFDLLKDEGLLKESDYRYLETDINPRRVDYEKQFNNKYKILKIACDNFKKLYKDEYDSFHSKQEFFSDEYALFLAIKEKFNGASFDVWPNEYKFCNPETLDNFKNENFELIDFYKTMQCLFFRQWFKLKKYANGKGIKIIGDIPIYSAYDSTEVWLHPENFHLDHNKLPIEVAGCPPDGYTTTGQLWGNPLYNFKYIEEKGFAYFIDKFSRLQRLYDVIRIDHFRGFDSFYAIPYGNKDATIGRWVEAPGKNLFKTIKETLGNVEIIVEDLGFLTDSLKNF